MAGPTRLELATSGVTGRRSNQLNYDPARSARNGCAAERLYRISARPGRLRATPIPSRRPVASASRWETGGRDTIAFAPLRSSPLNSRFATCRRFRSTSPSRPRRLGCTPVVSLSRLLPSTSASIVSRPRRRSAGSGSCDAVYHPRLASSSALLMTVSRSSCLVARTVAQERLTPATGESPGRRRAADCRRHRRCAGAPLRAPRALSLVPGGARPHRVTASGMSPHLNALRSDALALPRS